MAADQGRYHSGEHRQFTSLSSSTNIIPSSFTGQIDGMWIEAETQNVRIRFDGSAPTTGVGLILYAGAAPQYFPHDPTYCYAIEVSASAKLNVEFVGPKKTTSDH